jgi:hypothetical protein
MNYLGVVMKKCITILTAITLCIFSSISMASIEKAWPKTVKDLDYSLCFDEKSDFPEVMSYDHDWAGGKQHHGFKHKHNDIDPDDSPSAVPIPSMVWLFGPILLGMIDVNRKKMRKSELV